MGVVFRKDIGVSLRIGCIVRAATLRCNTVEIGDIPATKPLKTRRKVQVPKEVDQPPALPQYDRGESVYFATVQGALFKVPGSFFEQMSAQTRQQIMKPPEIGKSKDKPILLPGLTIPQFRSLLYASTVYPAIDLNRLSLDQVLSISEWAYNFGHLNLKSWSAATMASLFIPTANSPLRTASNEAFLRALRLAVVYRRPDILSSIQVKWLTRILWHELSPIPAILFADRYDFWSLLSHAYYTHMVELGPSRLVDRSAFLSDDSTILNQRQKTHLLAGFYSLSTYWKRLRISPPAFQPSPQCNLHKQCCAAWKMRWSAACSRPCAISDADVLRRLRFIEDVLKEDTLLNVCLAPGCRDAALDSISKKRTEISNNLHHHFDLT